MPDTRHDLIVVGCGVAGLAAATEALRLGLGVASLEAMLFGGLIINVNRLDGEIGGVGSEVASAMMDAALDLGMENLAAQVESIKPDADGYIVTSDSGVHAARTVIIASGARLKRLGLAGEETFEHNGVSHCADCDGPMLGGQVAVVVGGGDSAVQSAAVLAGYCAEVHLVHRSTGLSAKPQLVDALASHANVKYHGESRVDELLGDERLSAVRVTELRDRTTTDIAATAFFAFVGLEPVCDFAPAGLARDARGFVLTDATRQTALPGLFAAGAVRAGCGGMIADAIEDGHAAARAAAQALQLAA